MPKYSRHQCGTCSLFSPGLRRARFSLRLLGIPFSCDFVHALNRDEDDKQPWAWNLLPVGLLADWL